MIIAVHNLVGISVAMFLDVIGLLCLFLNYIIDPVIGEAISTITDWAGAIFFAIWIIAKEQGIISPSQVKKSKKSAFIKGVFTFLGESLPFIGGLPFWTIYVFSEIKEKRIQLKLIQKEK